MLKPTWSSRRTEREAQRELERKANALKELGTKHLGGMDFGRALKFLSDALEYCPEMKELWSNRSHAYAMMHDHEHALADAEKAIRRVLARSRAAVSRSPKSLERRPARMMSA